MAVALPVQFSCLCGLLPKPLLRLPTKPPRSIKSQIPPSQPQDPSANGDSAAETSSLSAPPKKPSSSSGVGFGSSSKASSPDPDKKSKNRKQKNRRDRAKIIRRTPVDTPAFLSEQEKGQSQERRRNEGAFLLAWLGLGSTILIEGVLLAASGFLPEELDKFFSKYLYPTFTPTVILFFAGAVAFGVLKYVENEKPKAQK